jgi:diguanylate cyclase (GGDEF)-like protein
VDDVDELFGMILEKSTAFLHAEQGSLMLLDEQRRELGVKAMKGLNKKIAGLLRIRPGEGIAGKVLATGSPLLVSDIEKDERITQERRLRYKTKSFVSVPLKLEGRTIGVLNVADKSSGEAFSDQDLHLLTSIGAYASVAIERSRFHLKTEELKKISITDPLTALLNRRYFQERMSEEIERSRRHRLPLSLIMIDLDDFKPVNDSLGHMAGDEVLQMVARCIRNSIRAIDVAARYGGEEFTVILPQTAKTDAISLAERICGEVARLELPYERKGRRLALTVSLGLATYPEDAGSLEDLIRNADSALYTAKAHGKNRVVVFRTSPK